MIAILKEAGSDITRVIKVPIPVLYPMYRQHAIQLIPATSSRFIWVFVRKGKSVTLSA